MSEYDMPSQTYFCQCAGCAKGQGSVFEAAPENWFRAKGISTPKNCPDCREWINTAGDSYVYCKYCTGRINLYRKYKIGYHKYKGKWQDPTECDMCKRAGADRVPRGVGGLPDDDDEIEEEEEKEYTFSDIAEGIPVESRIVTSSLADHQKCDAYVAGSNKKEVRQLHLEHHMAGSPNSWVGQIVPGRKQKPTATAMVDSYEDDCQVLLDSVSSSFATADPNTMREFAEGSDIVRLTLFPDGRIEKTIIRKRDGRNDYFVVSTFDNWKVSQLIQAYGRKQA